MFHANYASDQKGSTAICSSYRFQFALREHCGRTVKGFVMSVVPGLHTAGGK